MMATIAGVPDVATIILLWGLGITFAIYTVGSVSGGHLNPAVSFAFALLRPKQFPFYKLPAYILAQFLGAIIGAGINYSLYKPLFQWWEVKNEMDRGTINSLLGASTFGMYFPNPGLGIVSDWNNPQQVQVWKDAMTNGQAFWVEAWGTGLLMALILAYTDSRQLILPIKASPVLIGFTIASLVALYAPLTQGCLNPARDIGPRLVAHGLGWGKIAAPGPHGERGFWVYLLAPMIGSVCGGLMYELTIASGLESGDIELGAAKIDVGEKYGDKHKDRDQAAQAAKGQVDKQQTAQGAKPQVNEA